MGYSIDLELNDECVDNLTIENFSDEFIIDTDSFACWFDDNVDIDDFCEYDDNDNIIALTNDEIIALKIENVEEFKGSDSYYSFMDDYGSMSNTLQILQIEPQKEDIRLVTKYCSNVSLFFANELNVFGISNNGCGMDLSDNFALAYWIIDGYSPIDVSQVMSLSDEAEKLLRWFEATYKENNRKVSRYDMNKYLRG
jgi:hypothetical protein